MAILQHSSLPLSRLRVYLAAVLSTFERYTDAAKRAIYFARLEANHRDADSITPEHILAGLTWERDSTFVGIAPLKELAVTLRARMGLPHLPSTSFPYLRDRNIPLTDGAKMTLAFAVEEANLDRQYWLDCDHLLRGLLRFRNDASDVLEQYAINLGSLRSAAKLHRREHPVKPAPKWGYFKLAIHRSRPLLVWLILLIAILVVVLLVRLRDPV
jgi:ClpA/ClpB-like protein